MRAFEVSNQPLYCCVFVRLEDVESRLLQTATALEQSRHAAKKTKAEFEHVKKQR